MSERRKSIAVWDIGKTNAKICALDATTGELLEDRSQGFDSLPGPPYLHLDVDSIWSWFKENVADLAQRHHFTSIVVTAHGATAGLIDNKGLVLPILDYEDSSPDETEKEYAKVRPPFTESFSPILPGSINYGRGLFWLSKAHEEEFSKASHILSYTQYWTWRLCGVAATECTTIGSHSDLWQPAKCRFSSLVDKLGWRKLFPPMRRADEVLGKIDTSLARETNLPADCDVYCGIHDSNASLLPWLGCKEAPFTVSSTGTWVINLSVGCSLDKMSADRDCASNVSMYCDPVATSRWMGGREYANICGDSPFCADMDDLAQVLADKSLMLMPNQGGQAGPFLHKGDTPNNTLDSEPLRIRQAAASLYCSLMLDLTLDLCMTTGDVIVEGAFAKNKLLMHAVSALRPDTRLLVSEDITGTTFGAARLVLPNLPSPTARQVPPLEDTGDLIEHKRLWLEQAESA